jgi:uncharacterized protein (TIGR02145 family)
MCYNLGAAEKTKTMSIAQQMAYSNVYDVYGSLYQWGRATDGHEKRNSPVSSTQVTNLDANGQPALSSQIGRFISVYQDWRSPSSDLLWYNDGKTVNAPCPQGWRVPSSEEWRSIVNGNSAAQANISTEGVFTTSGNFWKWHAGIGSTPGWTISPDGGSTVTLFLPAGGYRNYTGEFLEIGQSGCYWSKTAVTGTTSATYLRLEKSTLRPNHSYFRASGHAIRCVSE